jgi:stage V sporulation protein AE
MEYLLAFLVGGSICAIGQFMMDKFKLLPIYITVLFVTIGSFLEMFGLYDKLIAIGHAGALIPISSFGHSLTHAAVEGAMENGYLGLLLGIFDLTAPGITSAILFAFVVAVVFRPKG